MVPMASPDTLYKIILASSSPRRIELLRQLGLRFEVCPSEIDEELVSDVPVADLVERNALAKAQDIARGIESGLVIGADTVVVCQGIVYGKPADSADAVRMLRQLVGRTHEVYSGVAVVQAEDGASRTAHAVTRVTFRPLSEAQITKYLDMVNPLDKAGAYAIQGVGGVIIEKIEGCYYNVVGLPLTVLDDLLAHFGTQLW
jgi:septum formation protein